MADAAFALGQTVTVEGKEGVFTIVKLMKSSAKVEQDGKVSIKPFALLEATDDAPSAKPSKTLTETKKELDAKKKSTKKKAAAKPKSRKRKAKDEDAEDEEPTPKSRKRKNSSYTMPQDEQEATLGDNDEDEATEEAAEKKKYPRSRDDKVAKELAKADTPTKMVAAIKKHSAYPHINKDAFKRLQSQKDLQFGLFRMRAGNLLRGAIARKAKK